MMERITTLWPEIVVLIGACASMLLGLSPSVITRRATPWVVGITLVIAGIVTLGWPAGAVLGPMVDYVKLAVIGVGLLLLAVVAGVPDQLRAVIETDERQIAGRGFEPANTLRGEFYAFFLFSVAGVMITAGARDLVWLFLALELTSLPGYIMVATSRDRIQAQEAAVKYFFLGAMAAAVFLYGFTLIYGATGTTEFTGIRDAIVAQYTDTGSLHPLLIAGFALAIVGIAFKIAAAPMHGYVADVYQGANVAVSAFLAFVPKTSGFVALILLLGLIPNDIFASQQLPPALFWLIWIMAAATMTIGNVLGVLQNNIKRLLAYSSVAHSGYMLVPLIAGAVPTSGEPGGGGAAVLFYLVAYGLATLGAFAVLGCLQQRGEEAQTFSDISGLARRHPMLGAVLLLSVLSLIGLPPMVGFVGKVYLFKTAYDGTGGATAAIVLVVIAVINSAISAVYYLRIAAASFFGDGREAAQPIAAPARLTGAAIAAVVALILGLSASHLVDAARAAGYAARPPLARDTTPPVDMSKLITAPADEPR